MGNFLACCPYQKWFVKGLVEASISTTQDINLVQIRLIDLLSRLSFCIPLYEPNLLLWGCFRCNAEFISSRCLWDVLPIGSVTNQYSLLLAPVQRTRSSLIHAQHCLASCNPWVQELCDPYLDHCKSFLPSLQYLHYPIYISTLLSY